MEKNELDKYVAEISPVKKMPSILSIAFHFQTDEKMSGMFRFNEFLYAIEFAKDPFFAPEKKKGDAIEDSDEVRLKFYMAKNYHIEPTVALIHEAIILMAYENIYHPIKSYLKSLTWDQIPRLDNWLINSVHCKDNPYSRDISKKIICAAIKRVFYPGCKFDYLMILEGEQGIYKSTMVRILGGEWYAPLLLSETNKDITDTLRGKWILEIEEMAGYSKADVEHVKGFLSRQSDRVRLAFRRNTQDFPRQSIVIGTINPDGDNSYLKDSTGNRRFLPIECTRKIEIGYLTDIRDQLFAEAMTTYETEELFMSSPESQEIALEVQQERQQVDGWAAAIDDWIEAHKVVEKITPHRILREIIGMSIEKVNNGYLGKIGRIMKTLGWKRIVEGASHRVFYVRPEKKWRDGQ